MYFMCRQKFYTQLKPNYRKETVFISHPCKCNAFDSMHPALLLSKLRAYGFQESLIRLLHSYLIM